MLSPTSPWLHHPTRFEPMRHFEDVLVNEPRFVTKLPRSGGARRPAQNGPRSHVKLEGLGLSLQPSPEDLRVIPLFLLMLPILIQIILPCRADWS